MVPIFCNYLACVIFREEIIWAKMCLSSALLLLEICFTTVNVYGPGSVVGISTGYRFDGLGVESRCGRDFLHLCRPALGPTQPLVQWVPGLSQG